VNCGLIVCVFLIQDDKPEQTVSETEETHSDITDESRKKEFGLELAPDGDIVDESEKNEFGVDLTHEDMDIVVDGGEGDESTDGILDDVLIIDSEDGIDEDTVPSTETDTDDAKPSGINILLIVFSAEKSSSLSL